MTKTTRLFASLALALLFLASVIASGYQVSTIAGTGLQGYAGDGGAAIDAELNTPGDVVVAADGTIYFVDAANFRVRRITPAGVIETVAGNGVCCSTGNGGPGPSASIHANVIALDATRNVLYIADHGNPSHVGVGTEQPTLRRLDLATGIIDHVADVLYAQGLAVDAAGSIYATETPLCRIVKVDPASGIVSHFAGSFPPDGCDGTGDGGPAAAAEFVLPTRLALDSAGNLFVRETGFSATGSPSDRIRRIDAATTIVTTVAGGGETLPGSGPATSMHLRVVDAISVDDTPGGATKLFIGSQWQVYVVDLTTGQLSVLAGGSIDGFQDGPAESALFRFVLGLAHAPDGAVIVADAFNHRLRRIAASGTGDVTIDGTAIVPAGLISVDGSLRIATRDGSSNTLLFSELMTIGADLNIRTGVGSDNAFTFPRLRAIGRHLAVTVGDGSSNTLMLDELTSVGGNVGIADGSVREPFSTGPCTNVTLGNLSEVGGDLILESCGSRSFAVGPVSAGGDMILDTRGYSTITGTTAAGATIVSNTTGEAAMTIALATGTFAAPVSFTLSHVEPASLPLQDGVTASGDPVTVDPVAAYQFTFAVPTLNVDASLTFDIFLPGLDAETRAALLDAIASSMATLATRGDAAADVYQTFPLCENGEVPTAGGCVVLELLDAAGQPTADTPTIVRFSNVVGHFSTWAVVLMRPPVVFNGLLQPYRTATQTATPTFKRGSVIPLKFNWTDADGNVIDSASAAPNVTIYPGPCSAAPTGTPIAADDAGNSGEFRYDTVTSTWVFGWSTRPVAEGCYWIRITSGTLAFPPPPQPFPVVLR